MSLVTLVSCAEKEEKKVYVVADVPPPPVAIDLYSRQVDSIFNLLSPAQKIEQLFWVEVNLSEKLKKEINMPRLAFYSSNIKADKYLKIAKDSIVFPPKYFSTSYFENFQNVEDLSFSPEDLLTIKDTIFWKKYFETLHAFNQTEGITCYIPEEVSLIDSVFNHRWHQLESRILDSMYRHKLLIGLINDTVHSGHNDFFANKNIGISLNLDSIPEVNDTVCKINLKSVALEGKMDEAFIEKILLGNYDGGFFVVRNEKEIASLNEFIAELPNNKLINEELLNYKVRKVIALKLWSSSKTNVRKEIVGIRLKGLLYQSKYKSISVLQNDNTLPITDFPDKKWSYINIGKKSCGAFEKDIQHYGPINERKTSLSGLSLSGNNDAPTIVILQEKLDSISGKNFVKKVKDHHKNHKTIVINMGHPGNVKFLKELPVLVQSWVNDEEHLAMVAQGIMGGNPIDGGTLEEDVKQLSTRKIRLSYTIPEEIGISKDSLKKMDRIAAEAVWGGVTPGCQVFAAKDGKVFMNNAYGYQTYLQKRKISTTTVYDIASVTKVASTTLCGMHMYDKGYYKIQDSLKLHLPDTLNKYLGHFSRLYNVNFQRLFTHTSGLPAGLPIYKMIDYMDSLTGRWDSYYCDEKNNCFKVEVAKDFYLDSAYLDSLWLDMNNIWTGEKKYKYSDANMNVLYQIFRSKLKKSQKFEKYMDSVFYSPLKLEGTCFLPLKRMDSTRIAPTEDDRFWRKQVIKGHVHDPNAAIYGGVAGNAGLFSTANDLGVIMQMLMFGGEYGGKRYINQATVKKFSSHQEGSHRGLGFDKPTASSGNVVAPDCPYTAYGHTGFTGICVWNDPENDVVFTFVSNRVHPSANNKKIITMGIRKRLHQVIYDQLYYNEDYKNKATGNVPVTRIKNKPI